MTAGPDPADLANQPSVAAPGPDPISPPPAGQVPPPAGQVPPPTGQVPPPIPEPPAQPTQVSSSLLSAGGDACPSCGAPMAKDQRYCLECGARRGDPRLPFMDAVVFMEASKQPEAAAAPPSPPSEARRGGVSNNAALIAGVGTLVLAIGVGVLIGRAGDNGTQTAASNTPQVIKVEGGGGGTATEPTEASGSGAAKGGGSGKSKGKGKKAEKSLETGSSGTSKAAEEVLKPSADAKPLPPPTTGVGDKCEKGVAGCNESGEFDGSFFE